MKKGFLTKAFVAVGVMASAIAMSSMCAFAATENWNYAKDGTKSSGNIVISTTLTETVSSTNKSASFSDSVLGGANNTDMVANIKGINALNVGKIGDANAGGVVKVTPGVSGVLKIYVMRTGSSDAGIFYVDSDEKVAAGRAANVQPITVNVVKNTTYEIGKSTNSAVGLFAMTLTEIDESVAVESVSIEGDTSVYVGKDLQLTAKVTPTNAVQTVTWESSDENVATVTNGKVKGVAAGTTTITATSTKDNTKFASVDVTVSVEPSAAALVDITNGTYSLVTAGNEKDIAASSMLFDNKAFVEKSGLKYSSSKNVYSLSNLKTEQTKQKVYRLKNNGAEIAIKLPAGKKVSAVIYTSSTTAVTAYLSSVLNGSGDLAKVSANTPNVISYTNDGTESKVVYIAADNDAYIQEFKIEDGTTLTNSGAVEAVGGKVYVDKTNNAAYVVAVVSQDAVDKSAANSKITLTIGNKSFESGSVYKSITDGSLQLDSSAVGVDGYYYAIKVTDVDSNAKVDKLVNFVYNIPTA